MHLMRARTDPRNYKERGTYHIVARVKLHVDGFSIALPCVVFGAPSHHWHLQFYIALPLSSEKMDMIVCQINLFHSVLTSCH